MSKPEHLEPALEPDMRPLRDDEVEAVGGGVIDGCFRFPTIPIVYPPPPKPIRDIFEPYTIG